MKYITAFAAAVLLTCPISVSHADEAAVGWHSVDDIVARIGSTHFPDKDFNATDFGARGDGQTDSQEAINNAIEACHEAGGGRVVVPAGEYRVDGPVRLKSNVNLHLAAECTLRFSTRPSDYLPVVFTRFEGTELMNYSPPIYAFEETNIGLTGSGVIDAQADFDNWWKWKGAWSGTPANALKDGDPDQSNAIDQVRAQADEGVPAEQRVYGEGSMLRSSFVQPYRCKDVLIEGITVKNSPMWCLHPVLSENVIVRGVTVDSHGPNNDGCNPESCRYVLIEGCTFDTGDDCIAIKSGRNTDGRRLNRPSEFYVIRNCKMRDGHGGVVLGSEMSGGVRNIFVEDCEMDSPHLERAIRLKSNSNRGGYLENLFVRNVQVGEVSDAVLRVNLYYAHETGEHPPVVRNIFVENLSSQKSRYAFYFRGLEEHPIASITIRNCTFAGADKPSVIEHVKQLTMENVTFPLE
ncbi:Probable polygalacturonase (PG) (Pectinase) [Durusdinium trenchii]|uniref:Probable polygalacturonase (PG) (Pectinase) n=1 Tax=Durusdinium trenchii TaxID=1381693 RepID=A0ABP0LE64_9DINO